MRLALQNQHDICEKKMFGGLTFRSRGHLFIGITGDVLMARSGPEHYRQALSRPHVRVMDFTGMPMKGYVFVDPSGFGTDAGLSDWVERCHRFARSLPPEKPT